MSSDFSSCLRDVDLILYFMLLHLGDSNLMLKLTATRFARKKSSIERLVDIAQFGSYYIRGVGLPFVDSCKDLGTIS